MKPLLASLVSLILATNCVAACYTVYDRNDRILYRGDSSPVDISRPLSVQIQTIWPDASMVVTPDSALCTSQDSRMDSTTASRIARRDATGGAVVGKRDPTQKTLQISPHNLNEVLSQWDERDDVEGSDSAIGVVTSGAGKTVHVREYYRNGHRVRAHTRGSPGSRGGSAGRGGRK